METVQMQYIKISNLIAELSSIGKHEINIIATAQHIVANANLSKDEKEAIRAKLVVALIECEKENAITCVEPYDRVQVVIKAIKMVFE